ncbi:PREDICTED: uncharacterized protein LOC106813822 [Priapulus caudatus]|uniref:Uncharacterized protein LOC106813822 n=1 Tax=Priapulus caudatus TaxID=37621 RepID=A0ABM1EMW5_PRICU|nr:PREDICTED: uncharacterized protein LOC106813822 [Priapulus caudatus]
MAPKRKLSMPTAPIRIDKRRKRPSTVRKMTRAQVQEVRGKLEEIERTELVANVNEAVESELHMEIGHRKLFLQSLHSNGFFAVLVGNLFTLFMELYGSSFSNRPIDSYVAFQLVWLNTVSYAFSDIDVIKLGPGAGSTSTSTSDTDAMHKSLMREQWQRAVASFPVADSTSDDSTNDVRQVGHAIASAVFRKASEWLIKIKSSTEESLATVESLHEESEYALLAIAGGCVNLVKRVVTRRQLSKSARQRREGNALLILITTCVRTTEQKRRVPMPTPLRIRDRGGLLVPQRVFLLWLRNLDRAIRTIASESGIALYGKNIIKITSQQVNAMDHLRDIFGEAARYACTMAKCNATNSTISTLHRMWQTKIVNARVNECMISHQLGVAEQQGNPMMKGGLTLRDELYCLAKKQL